MTSPAGPYPLYDRHADLWPLVAPLDSYEEEMVAWAELISAELGPRDLRVLDLGTGGGHHLYQLVEAWPQVMTGSASDLSVSMLERVARLVRGFTTLQADMTSLRLAEQFPLVTVHDSFCYLTDMGQVQSLFETIAIHLEPAGMAVVKVDALAGEFVGPYRYLTTYEDDQREVTLAHYEWDPDPADSWLEVVYVFFERAGGQLSTREERHRLGLFSRAQLKAAAGAAGLKTRWVELERWDEDRPNSLMVLRPTKGLRPRKGNQQP